MLLIFCGQDARTTVNFSKLLGIVFYWQVPNYENPKIL
jgi:hypothetical protein